MEKRTSLYKLEPTGIERLKEALESNDWESHCQLKSALDWDVDDNEADHGFEAEAAEIKNEMNEMRQSIYPHEEKTSSVDDEVEKLQAMMLKIQAARGNLFISFCSPLIYPSSD